MKSSSKQTPRYRVRNWRMYNAALVNRGSLTLWLDEETIQGWYAGSAVGQEGHPSVYSNTAIAAVLTMGKVFHLPLRATEGFVASVFRQCGQPLDVPDYTTLSRRGRNLEVRLRSSKTDGGEPTHIIVDSTGVKVYGEGEWKVRQHGWTKRRTWRKIHIAIDEKGEIKAAEVTGNDVHDAEVLPTLIREMRPKSVTGDGAYDTRKIYEALREKDVLAIRIPPQHNARIWQNGNTEGEPHPRDENLRAIRAKGRKRWKIEVGYHIRSRVETTMFRLKTIFGERLRSRRWSRQVVECRLMAAALNRMWALGMPASYRYRVA